MSNVFVSHRGADSAAAERLADDLRHRGHTVWLDVWAIGIGDSIVGQVNKGLEGATFLVLCYSAAGSLSPWMSQEWMSALARQLGGADIRVLPVRLTGGEPPAILADIKYADLIGDWAAGIDALCAAMR
ncbi:toll/interleukin-1 receptor domain-containing protein [Nocardia takedensis]|uniref:toll/interleukin-1 receptor domain-containing protein n=1 Tax=Nocardia takedensis TaxID=259390 RepID=UPI0007C4E1FF|nr:toll/interleukin-1 receptor domain-containing protein [Nocardia takedensis]